MNDYNLKALIYIYKLAVDNVFYRLTETSRSNHFAPDGSKVVLKQAFQILLKEEGG